jgi:antitoxin component HigA of HigAB toxin-antitoxin module
MAKKMIRPIRTETEYDDALEEIEQYFENEPKSGTPEADRFDLLALIVEDYERKRWPIDPTGTIEAATPKELAGIGRGLKDAREGRFATDEQVKAAFDQFRRA